MQRRVPQFQSTSLGMLHRGTWRIKYALLPSCMSHLDVLQLVFFPIITGGPVGENQDTFLHSTSTDYNRVPSTAGLIVAFHTAASRTFCSADTDLALIEGEFISRCNIVYSIYGVCTLRYHLHQDMLSEQSLLPYRPMDSVEINEITMALAMSPRKLLLVRHLPSILH
ncbi:hypothetical protein NPIL_601651 [Nephila pilipes]|uniref:Uncharacterized protein n=1 Tax=Nephila pilipes TaxID=299642 RepID=A0A8X6I489_NEPPI|nr:hypothetical protein NPIL_601651 [Nephila pilipes]